jgi:DNA repair protein RadC
MKKDNDKNKIMLKDSYFDGFEYKGYRVKTKLVIEGQKEYRPLSLSCSGEVYNSFKNLAESDRQKFYAVHLDSKNKVIRVDMVSQGTIDSSPVHPREVFKPAILNSAASVIFVHSHPTGDPEPSVSDKELTRQLEMAAEIMGIEVLDHVIIGRDKYYSFADKGELWVKNQKSLMKSGSK